ncbi:hypothetical protein [Burkholderia sp. Ac-20365]|uniref:hypothetical protein n=1 Tax=Burkholderia sp. Ac-20365 TaxID=2703897 RepID=UPI00197C18D6|nr:hypothetical protein [Burkholderia sp. Ac-20365]MBN3761198.1 hypothetical protein [Burkholderia sp. Ac-20365]
MMNTLVPHNHRVRKVELPRWIRVVEAAFLWLSLIPAIWLLIIGAVWGHPVYDAIAHVGATWLLPLVSYLDGVFSPLNGAASILRPKFGSLGLLSQASTERLFVGSVLLGVAAIFLSAVTSVILHHRNNRAARDIINW